MARNYLKKGVDPLRPVYDDLSNIQSGLDNPQGLRMVEFPLYQLSAVGLFKLFNISSIEVSLRLVSVIASGLTALIIYILVSHIISLSVGFTAALIFSIIPYSIFYGRAILPEMFATSLALVSLSCLYAYFQIPQKSGWRRILLFITSMLAASCALLAKPTVIFLLIPAPYLFLKGFSRRAGFLVATGIYFFVALFPLWWWRVWISQFPEGIPANEWLFNGGNIRFKGAWFYWIFAERIAKLILGYWGVGFLLVGLIVKRVKKEGWFFTIWAVGILLYLIVFARGNVQHDYYQILLLPTLAVFSAKGVNHLLNSVSYERKFSYPAAAAVIIFMFGFSWYTIRTYYWINRSDLIAAGRVADTLLPPGVKVIAPNNGDTTFLYQINRQGWPIGFDIPAKINAGAQYYVTVSPTDSDLETKELSEKYTVLVRNDEFAIIDLTQPQQK
ncbi:hypothetical protein A2154_01595 [Candidatus Gottesmanbacteria bacterium RBG_16_43_7]|uniref:Glycosyltransferase RgtA/B/C/D-like domain-containing protein n=1 Tax=Candidatus Gottesmanbacteria bacterium RBG_16_43_7 TaxID=1798373 RepID=A0A1F5ZCP7_9BACT|nr:MAG: hypothetical protein A2154_01595 [Candidatus Gottesmanbacteria bacterium RBG_16_43_7]